MKNGAGIGGNPEIALIRSGDHRFVGDGARIQQRGEAGNFGERLALLNGCGSRWDVPARNDTVLLAESDFAEYGELRVALDLIDDGEKGPAVTGVFGFEDALAGADREPMV